MVIERREQVFISSTFKDLVEERRSVMQTLLEADCIPSGMELFPASDDEKFDLIKGVIDLCDYYVVIVGGRYGSVDDEAEISYTEMEFDYAVSQDKPVMGFLHGDPGKLIGDKIELDSGLRSKLDSFRTKIEKKVVKYWHEPRDLPGQVALAIMQIRKSHPVEGWIRASQAMTPEVQAELIELRAKVRELSADLKDEQLHHRENVDSSDLSQGEDETSLDCTVRIHWKSSIEMHAAKTHNRLRMAWSAKTTWNEIAKQVGPLLMDEATEREMRVSLSDLCLKIAERDLVGSVYEADPDDGDDDEEVGRVYEADISSDSFHDVKVQLVALGLIEKGIKRRPSSDGNTYWQLTSLGHHQLLRLRAARRSDLTPDED